MIICEIGLNHLGNQQYAHEYVNKVIKSKADGITFYIGNKSFYLQQKFSDFVLPDYFYEKISKTLRQNNVKFGVMISDVSKIDFFENIHVNFYKVFSNDIRNLDLISKLTQTKKRVLVSTGMSDLNEIEKLVDFIKESKERFTLIHTQLSNKLDLVNLKAIPMLRKRFEMPIAFGSHAQNTNVLLVALAYEPSELLFYVKGNKTKNHPDERHAIKLKELKNMIKNLRELPKTLGEEVKIKTKNEIAYKTD